jgi:hypothetical protein
VFIGLFLSVALLIGAEYYRGSKTPGLPMLPVAFEHGDHTDTRCVTCHHDYIDGTGNGICYQCHKNSPDIAADMESTFHDFCFDCHATKRTEGEDSGPQRECSGCHQQDSMMD